MKQEFVQQINNSIQEFLDGVHTCIPGEIISFDSGKCEAIVRPIGKFKKPDGSKIDYPKIAKVPVKFQQSCKQESSITFPVKPGDGCLLLFSEQALDAWRSGGDNLPDLKHDLTNAIAIMGVCKDPNPLVKEAESKDAIIIRHKNAKGVFSNDEVFIKRHDTQFLQMKGSEIILQNGGTILKLTPDSVEVIGNLKVSKTAAAEIDVIGGGISLRSHSHRNNGNGPPK